MAVSRAMRRLLAVREIEEEQKKTALESAVGDLRRMENALAATHVRERGGRRLIAESARTGELVDRMAGVEEARAARHHASVLRPRIAAAETVVAARRQEFLLKRIERRQVESLIRKMEAEDATEAGRHAQRELDDWFLSGVRRGASAGVRQLQDAAKEILQNGRSADAANLSEKARRRETNS